MSWFSPCAGMSRPVCLVSPSRRRLEFQHSYFVKGGEFPRGATATQRLLVRRRCERRRAPYRSSADHPIEVLAAVMNKICLVFCTCRESGLTHAADPLLAHRSSPIKSISVNGFKSCSGRLCVWYICMWACGRLWPLVPGQGRDGVCELGV